MNTHEGGNIVPQNLDNEIARINTTPLTLNEILKVLRNQGSLKQ